MRALMRSGLAVLVTLIATAGAWFAFVREDDGAPETVDATSPGAPAAEPADLTGGLTTEQKVDQVLLLGFEGTEAGGFASALESQQLGGIVLGSPNYSDPGQLGALIEDLREAAEAGGDVPPLIVTTQEGGEYRAFDDLPPDQRQLDVGDSGDPALAEEWARRTGQSLAALGFDLNLAPVADVATLDSPIADRSFSDDPAIAAAMTAAAIRGCEAAGIACAVRHFPGLGAASESTDRGPATVSLDPAGLYARDIAAFSAAFSEGVGAVVVSHAFYASYDPVVPASLSAAVTTDLLRSELGFEGVAITDDLSAGAIKATHEVPEAAVSALNAGADLLLISSPLDQIGVRERLVQAVASGEISAARLDEAVSRVLALKEELGLLDPA